jgi:hypothetical protein
MVQTEMQKNLKLFIFCVIGLSILSIVDLFGFSASKHFGFSSIYISLFSLILILVFTFFANKLISPKAAIRTGFLLGFFESAFGQIWFIQSTNGELI